MRSPFFVRVAPTGNQWRHRLLQWIAGVCLMLTAVHAVASSTLAVGFGHTCEIVNGGAQCWGANTFGQLGDGSQAAHPLPASVSLLGPGSGVTSIAAGHGHSCAVVQGTVACWGLNTSGQLGSGDTVSSSEPVDVLGLPEGVPVTALVAGFSHTCAIAGGAVYCWGENALHQLGNGITNPSSVATPVTGLTAPATRISAGADHTCVVAGGGAACWGNNDQGQAGSNSPAIATAVIGLDPDTDAGVTDIGAGYDHSCAVVNGAVLCWGDNVAGQLGDGTTDDSLVPVLVAGLSEAAVAIDAGNNFSCAIVGAQAWCWGWNSKGQLGDGTTTDRLAPVAVQGPNVDVVALEAGDSHTCIHAGGSLRCWGSNLYGQLGNGEDSRQRTPVVALGPVLPAPTSIAVGLRHSCAAHGFGARCWGENSQGQLGDGTVSLRAIPGNVFGMAPNFFATHGVVAVATGSLHSCAIVTVASVPADQREVRCWGSDGFGQLGNGAATGPATVPKTVSGIVAAHAIAVGDAHACVLVDGGIECWGRNNKGQLGDGSNVDRDAPVAVGGLAPGTGADVVAISAGKSHTCAVIDDGVANSVRCWGDNDFKQLGVAGGSSNEPGPAVVFLESGSEPSQVAAGDAHTCARLKNGTIQCWGSDGNGRLGDGPASGSGHVPVVVIDLGGVASTVVAGRSHTCATVGGGVRCWGFNGSGQLGDGTTMSASAPVSAIPPASGASRVSAGADVTCAVVLNSVQCWGSKLFGALGNGTLAPFEVTPVAVLGLDGGSDLLADGFE